MVQSGRSVLTIGVEIVEQDVLSGDRATADSEELRSHRPPEAAWGAVYGLMVFGVMWYVVVPLVDPVMLKLNPVVFAISHMMWGAALGLLVPQPLGVAAGLQSA